LRELLSETGGRVLSGHNAPVNAVAVSSSNRWIASVDENGDSYLWDLNAAGPTADRRKLAGARAPFAFSNDGLWLPTATATGSQPGETRVLLWDLGRTDPSLSPRLFTGVSHNLDVVAISSDNRLLVSGMTRQAANWSEFDDRKVVARIWDLTRPKAETAP